MLSIYTGKHFLAFERFPHYQNGNNRLAKVLLNLGFTKLCLRVKPTGYKPEAIEMAERCFARLATMEYNENTNEFKFPPYTHGDKEEFEEVFCLNDKGANMGSLADLFYLLKHDCVADYEYQNVLYSREYDGYIGFSHRAAQVFKIGDMLFDETWETEGGTQDIPFVKRGFKKIEDRAECRQAARNFAMYVS